MVNFTNALRRKATALESDLIHSIGVRVARRRGHGKRQDILGDGGAASDVGMRPNAHKLMHRAKRAHHSPFFHRHMPAQCRAVHQHAVVANHAVVPDVGVGHDQDMAADASESAAFHGTAADGHAFANLIVVANLQSRWLAPVGNILRRHAYGGERKECVVSSDFRWSVDCDVRYQTAALAQFDVGSNHAIWTDFAGGWIAVGWMAEGWIGVESTFMVVF